MKTFVRTLLAGTVLALVAGQASAFTTNGFGTVGLDAYPAVIIDVFDNGIVVSHTNQGPLDGVEDTYVGVRNYSHTAVNLLHLASAIGTTGVDAIFDFEGDGGFAAVSGFGSTYRGPNVTFSGVAADHHSGDVNFGAGGVDPVNTGSNTYSGNGAPLPDFTNTNADANDVPGTAVFSLENNLPTSNDLQVTGVPEPATVVMLGMGVLSLAGYRRRMRKVAA